MRPPCRDVDMVDSNAVIACPACNSFDHRLVENHQEYRVLSCSRCRLSFADPMKGGDPNYYKMHLVYEDTDSITVREHFQAAEKPANRRLLAMVTKCGRIMDIGCGFGGFVRLALNEGFDAYGMDFNEAQVTAGKTALCLKDRLFTGDINSFAARDDMIGTFDLVTLFEVIEHVENIKELVHNVRRLLKKGGLCALTCPNETRWQPTGRIFVDYPPHHLTRWRPDTLRGFLEANGFEHVWTDVESRISDPVWVAYVNWSAGRRQSRRNGVGNHTEKRRRGWERETRKFFFDFFKKVCIPFDLILKAAGVGTMGMRMIVRTI
jgi:SAM-dependent methyltransferase